MDLTLRLAPLHVGSAMPVHYPSKQKPDYPVRAHAPRARTQSVARVSGPHFVKFLAERVICVRNAMDYFAAVRAFVCAAEVQSFSKTAHEMAVKTSTVSRYVSELEKDLGIALFNRSTRGLVLTEGGRLFREHALVALQALEEARQVTSSLNRTPQGLLRVTVPSA